MWLIRVLDGVEPERTFTTWFVDIDPRQWWAPHVERMAALELSRGCSVIRPVSVPTTRSPAPPAECHPVSEKLDVVS